MNKTQLYEAFTLSEVLITLAIIGIVAALTIPTILNYAFEREAVSKAKETYSILLQAVTQWQSDNDCLGDSAKCSYNPWCPIGSKILPYMKTVESYSFCANDPARSLTATLPWLPEKTTVLSVNLDSQRGVGYGMFDKTVDYDLSTLALLPNGVIIVISGNAPGGTLIMFDINGAKGPNRVGKDQFITNLANNQNKTFNPYFGFTFWSGSKLVNGVCNTVANTCTPDDGHSPMAYVLTHDKLPDLKAMGYPTAP